MLGAASLPSKMFLRAAFLVLLALTGPAPAVASAPIAGESSLRVADAAAVETRTNGKIFGTDPARSSAPTRQDLRHRPGKIFGTDPRGPLHLLGNGAGHTEPLDRAHRRSLCGRGASLGPEHRLRPRL
jgi:hypothetical protein